MAGPPGGGARGVLPGRLGRAPPAARCRRGPRRLHLRAAVLGEVRPRPAPGRAARRPGHGRRALRGAARLLHRRRRPARQPGAELADLREKASAFQRRRLQLGLRDAPGPPAPAGRDPRVLRPYGGLRLAPAVDREGPRRRRRRVRHRQHGAGAGMPAAAWGSPTGCGRWSPSGRVRSAGGRGPPLPRADQAAAPGGPARDAPRAGRAGHPRGRPDRAPRASTRTPTTIPSARWSAGRPQRGS